MTPIIKISAIILLTVFAVILVRSNNKEFSFLVESAGAVLVLYLLVSSLAETIRQLNSWVSSYSEMQAYFSLILKAFSIVCATHFIAALCKDSGNGLLATCIEFAGRVAVAVLSLPFIEAVVNAAADML